jgi:hypothetical protein
VIAAATEALKANPNDVTACVILVRDSVDRGELAEAESLSHCGDSSELLRLRAEILDAGGRYEEAVALYDRAGFTLHAAAVLYQSLGGTEAALHRMHEEVPPVAVHRGWMAAMAGTAPSVDGLDASPEATMLRALAGDPTAAGELMALPGVEPKILSARLGNPEAVSALLAATPVSEWALRLAWMYGDRAAAEVQLLQADPAHLALLGNPGRREAPLAGLVGPALFSKQDYPVPAGISDVGEAWRAAAELRGPDRVAALDDLQAEHPELRVLARIRARAMWDLPALAGDPWLDAPPPPL